MNDSHIINWEYRLTRYLVDCLQRIKPDKYRYLSLASDWWYTFRYENVEPPNEMAEDVKLVRRIANFIRMGSMSGHFDMTLHESITKYHIDSKSGEDDNLWLKDIEKSLLRERPHLFPYWHASASPKIEDDLKLLIGKSKIWKEILRLIRVASMSEVTTHITGETGTGKSLVAETIHNASTREGSSFVNISCGNLTLENYDIELANAVASSQNVDEVGRDYLSLFRAVGTICFDDITETSLNVQKKIINTLEILGDNGYRSLSPRIISTSSKSPERCVMQGDFRRDLFFRISIFQIELPALRQRLEDIKLLVPIIMEELAEKNGIKKPLISELSFRKLETNNWFGNIRELRNVLERAMLMADSIVDEEHLLFDPIVYSGIDVNVNDSRVTQLVDLLDKQGVTINSAMPDALVEFMVSLGSRRFRTKDLADELGIANSTARAYLARLAKADLVKQFGAKKGTTYQSNLSALYVKK
jgi:DNA-binding NtrC family response regulator